MAFEDAQDESPTSAVSKHSVDSVFGDVVHMKTTISRLQTQMDYVTTTVLPATLSGPLKNTAALAEILVQSFIRVLSMKPRKVRSLNKKTKDKLIKVLLEDDENVIPDGGITRSYTEVQVPTGFATFQKLCFDLDAALGNLPKHRPIFFPT